MSDSRFQDLQLEEGPPTGPEPAGLCMRPHSLSVRLWSMHGLGLERAIMPDAATRSDISVEDSLRMAMDVVDNARPDMLQNWLEYFLEVLVTSATDAEHA